MQENEKKKTKIAYHENHHLLTAFNEIFFYMQILVIHFLDAMLRCDVNEQKKDQISFQPSPLFHAYYSYEQDTLRTQQNSSVVVRSKQNKFRFRSHSLSIYSMNLTAAIIIMTNILKCRCRERFQLPKFLQQTEFCDDNIENDEDDFEDICR